MGILWKDLGDSRGILGCSPFGALWEPFWKLQTAGEGVKFEVVAVGVAVVPQVEADQQADQRIWRGEKELELGIPQGFLGIP